MATEQFANSAQTTLMFGVGVPDTAINVVSASEFPTSPQFRIQMGDELALVTGVSGTTWTVTRGIENTAPASHSAGEAVTQVLTAAVMNALGALGANQSANVVFAGPASGSATAPAFRALVPADLPGGNWVTGTITAQAQLNANWTVVGNNVFLDISGSGGSTVDITITAGTWLVFYSVAAGMTAAAGQIQCQVYDATNSMAVSGSQRRIVQSTATGNSIGGTATGIVPFVATGTTTLRLQGLRSVNTISGNIIAGITTLQAIRIA